MVKIYTQWNIYLPINGSLYVKPSIIFLLLDLRTPEHRVNAGESWGLSAVRLAAYLEISESRKLNNHGDWNNNSKVKYSTICTYWRGFVHSNFLYILYLTKSNWEKCNYRPSINYMFMYMHGVCQDWFTGGGEGKGCRWGYNLGKRSARGGQIYYIHQIHFSIWKANISCHHYYNNVSPIL